SDLRCQLLLQQLLVYLRLRLQQRYGGVDLFNDCLRLIPVRHFGGDLLLEPVDFRSVLRQPGRQLPPFGGHEDRIGVCGSREGLGVAQNHRTQARNIELRLNQIAGDAVAVRTVRRRIELDQNIAGIDVIAVSDHDLFDDANFQGLDLFYLAGGDEASVCGRDNVELADASPADRHGDDQDDDSHHDPAGR